MSLAFHINWRGTHERSTTTLRSRLRYLPRLRFKVLGAFVFAGLLPAAIASQLDSGATLSAVAMTAAWALGSAVLGMFIHGRITSYPASNSLAFVPLVLSVSFVLAWWGLLLTSGGHSGFQFALAFFFTTVWFLLVTGVEKLTPASILLVPFGDARLSDSGQRPSERTDRATQLPLPLDRTDEFDRRRPSRASEWIVARSTSDRPIGVSGVVADLRADLPAEWERFLERCALEGTPIYDLKAVRERLGGTVVIERLSENDLSARVASSGYVGVKRAFDLFVAVLAAPVVLLIAAAVAIAIKLDDGGPVFFSQERVGYRGRTFRMVKFRTMRAAEGPLSTRTDDARITRSGAFLRRCKLDELPQILNILRGEMSWIGPRPEPRRMAERYRTRIPLYDYRHIIRPGITGWAQVNQGYVEEDVSGAGGKLRYDFFYIKYFSLWLDLLVCARTVMVVLTGFGAR